MMTNEDRSICKANSVSDSSRANMNNFIISLVIFQFVKHSCSKQPSIFTLNNVKACENSEKNPIHFRALLENLGQNKV